MHRWPSHNQYWIIRCSPSAVLFFSYYFYLAFTSESLCRQCILYYCKFVWCLCVSCYNNSLELYTTVQYIQSSTVVDFQPACHLPVASCRCLWMFVCCLYGLRLWNSLPVTLWLHSLFRRKLKLHVFRQSYPLTLFCSFLRFVVAMVVLAVTFPYATLKNSMQCNSI